MTIHRGRHRLVACAVLAGVLFIVVGLAYHQPWFLAFDEWMQGYLYDALGRLGRTVFVGITYVGSAYVSYPIMGLLVYVLIRQKRYGLMLLSGLTLLGGRLCNRLLKAVFERPRPELTHLVQVSSDSFPSGHAMNAIVLFGFLAFLASQAVKNTATLPGWIWGSTIVLVGLIGFSRIYLGVHYPSDVLGGWLAGAAWLFVSVCLYTYLPANERFKQPVRAAERDW